MSRAGFPEFLIEFVLCSQRLDERVADRFISFGKHHEGPDDLGLVHRTSKPPTHGHPQHVPAVGFGA